MELRGTEAKASLYLVLLWVEFSYDVAYFGLWNAIRAGMTASTRSALLNSVSAAALCLQQDSTAELFGMVVKVSLIPLMVLGGVT